VCRGIKRLEPLLVRVVSIPECDGLNPEEIRDLIVDATENPIERPKYDQKKYYSGKKKHHTLKTEIRVTRAGRIVHVSDTVPGSVHDFKLLEEGEEISPKIHVLADSGYQGILNIHENSEIPKKKPKNRELGEEEKAKNRALSKIRVVVENILRDMNPVRY
jgi:IS5 family transposase